MGLSLSAASLLRVDDRVYWVRYPSTPQQVRALASSLRRHADPAHTMVWNLADAYDPRCFDGRVVHLRFGGYMCPPLLMLVEACASIHSWLAADRANVVAVHCKTGKGRSATLLCCALAWHRARR